MIIKFVTKITFHFLKLRFFLNRSCYLYQITEFTSIAVCGCRNAETTQTNGELKCRFNEGMYRLAFSADNEITWEEQEEGTKCTLRILVCLQLVTASHIKNWAALIGKAKFKLWTTSPKTPLQRASPYCGFGYIRALASKNYFILCKQVSFKFYCDIFFVSNLFHTTASSPSLWMGNMPWYTIGDLLRRYQCSSAWAMGKDSCVAFSVGRWK